MQSSLLQETKIVRVANDAAAGQALITSSAVDMSGFDSVIFLALVGTVVSGAGEQLTVYSNPTNSNSGGKQEGQTLAYTDPGTPSSSNGMFACEVIKPSQRYVYATFNPTAQNVTLTE